MERVELTRELLMDAGGHVEMKKARAIHREGGVKSAEYRDGVLSGETRVSGKIKRVSMEIISRTNMENHCTCLMVRRDGRVCAHVMAIGLEVVDPQLKPQEEEASQEDQWPKIAESGTELKLQVMLPLKVPESWQRESLMVGFGAEKEGEEILLSAVGEGPFVLDDHDAELWRILREFFPSGPPGVVTLEQDWFLQMLESLIGHPRVWLGKKAQVKVLGIGPRRALKLIGERVRASPGNLETWEFDGGSFRPLAAGLPKKYHAIFRSGYVMGEAEGREVLGELERWFEISDDLVTNLPEEGVPEIRVILEGSLRHLEARLEFFYDGQKAVSDEGVARRVGNLLTNPSREAAVYDFFHAWNFEGPVKGGRMAAREREDILKFHAFAELPDDWQIEKGERFEAAAKQIVAVKPDWEWQGGSGQDWFAIETKFHAGGQELSRDQVRRMMMMGGSEQAMGRGKIAVVDEEFLDEVSETLVDAGANQNSPGVFEVDARQAAFLRTSARDFGMAPPASEAVIELDLPDFLRPYQAEGVRWMAGLAEVGMGGILADDMGLGKTLQTLVFLNSLDGPALVVCPSSLVSNWAAEAKKWVPEMTVACFEGGKRGAIPEVNLVITSYAILRIDAAKFAAKEFAAVALDEAQQIKNPEAQVTKAAHRLNAKHRFALSGTPVENSLQDLWSIMQFVLPGFLGPRKAFLERFEKPLRKGNDPALARRLGRRLKPVVLRRLKNEVAKDLPERIEQVRYCDLTPKQSSIYRQLLQESRSQVDEAEDGKKRMVALTALLRLRQACCDLRLLPGLKVDDQEAGIKLRELESLLEEAVSGGHRVLVFSQFVQLLQGVVPMLAERGWDFCYLDGSTKKRSEVTGKFQEGKTPVFLISLKAGGVGLNLTAADTVIHLDPWWNPAVEAQATDRAHRIGQKRVVTSYKLITRGTVEEKILALQEEKKGMLEAALEGGAALVPGLAEEEMMGLFG